MNQSYLYNPSSTDEDYFIPINYITVDSVITPKKGSNMSLQEKLKIYADNEFNVLLIGAHGIGKSTIVKQISEQLGLNFKYYSSSTLDPYSELIGIPVPQEDKTILFYRPADLEDAEFIFFDELNRAHPRVLNAVLEIIQFKSINGKPLDKLKMVWAAINPPGYDYQVEELDPALLDRFHIYVNMEANVDINYMKNYMPETVAKILRDWWEQELNIEQRKALTPRRIEYIGTMIAKSIPWRDALPRGHKFPIQSLINHLKISLGEVSGEVIISKDYILNNIDEILEKIDNDPKMVIKLSYFIKKFDHDEFFECRDIVEKFPSEIVFDIAKPKSLIMKRAIHEHFEKNNILITNYPKIQKHFFTELI